MYRQITLIIFILGLISCSRPDSIVGEYKIVSAWSLLPNGTLMPVENSSVVGHVIKINKNMIDFEASKRSIKDIRKKYLSEQDFLEEWSGSGQAPIRFSDIHYSGKNLVEFWLRYNYSGDVTDKDILQRKFINTIYVLNDGQYLFVGDLFYLCQKYK